MRNHGPMRWAALALLLGSLLALASVASGAVNGGTISVNRGAAGIELGMKRSAVVDELGPPLDRNRRWLAYGGGNNLFDLYLNNRKRVRLLGISGESFCLRDGPCLFERWGVQRLKNHFGDRLRKIQLETGETVLVVRGHHRGRRVFTSFSPNRLKPRGKIIQVFIGRCPPRPAICGA